MTDRNQEETPAELPLRSNGRYALMRRLGGGAQATTWEAVDKREGKPVVVKELRVRGAASWKEIELAEREAKVLQNIQHDLCPKYVDHFEEDGCLYLVMSKIDGQSVQALRSEGALTWSDVAQFLRDAASVLEYLHGFSPPLIHRDIKPSNVLRRSDGRYCLIDFGAVRDSLKPEGGSTVVGTFGYMAPEQFQGRALPTTDLYAVGTTALYMLTGLDPDEMPHRGLTIDVRKLLSGSVGYDAQGLLTRLVEPNPELRPKSLRAALDQYGIEPDAASHARAEAKPPPRSRASFSSAPPAEGDAPNPIQYFVFILVTLALTLAQIAVHIALRRVVPLVLRILGALFNPRLRYVARRVRSVGDEVARQLGESRSEVERNLDPFRGGARAPRVDGSQRRRRVRVRPPRPDVIDTAGESVDDTESGQDEVPGEDANSGSVKRTP